MDKTTTKTCVGCGDILQTLIWHQRIPYSRTYFYNCCSDSLFPLWSRAFPRSTYGVHFASQRRYSKIFTNKYRQVEPLLGQTQDTAKQKQQVRNIFCSTEMSTEYHLKNFVVADNRKVSIMSSNDYFDMGMIESVWERTLLRRLGQLNLHRIESARGCRNCISALYVHRLLNVFSVAAENYVDDFTYFSTDNNRK